MTDESIFAAARAIADPAERAAYLDHACAGDAALRREVDELLAADGRTGQFLDAPPSVPVWQPGPYRPPESVGTAGAVIAGRYKLLQKLGEGGMGTVWMAEQTAPVKRLAALKLVKPGMDSGEVIARFEAERQALARMDHPNIAKVHDGGTTQAGRPYFVMELVKGVAITDFCDRERLTTRQRLGLFVSVCQAVQHAHQKGIIHRDLKPSNILVTVHDVTPVVKVIDFGVAKATGERLTERTLYTAMAQLVGTPLYMSPEQAGLSGLDVDTRSDIYSLGVLLYKLLTGTTPFDQEVLHRAGQDEMRRMIREDEPPRPSTRLSTLEVAELSTLAERRGVEPRRLCQEVRGELDWVVMRCLEKDRNRRYETASALAADVQRYLDDEPVTACPPSAGYRLRKFARRHRRPLATAGLVAAVLMVATAVSTWQAVKARDAERRASNEAAIARAVNDFLQEDLLGETASAPPPGREFEGEPYLTVKEALDRAAARIGDRFQDQPLVEAAIRTTIGAAYVKLNEWQRAGSHLEQAVALRKAHLSADHPDTLASMHSLAFACIWLGRFQDAIALRQQILEKRKALYGPDHPETLSCVGVLAQAYQSAGQWSTSMRLWEHLLEQRRTISGPTHPDTLWTMHGLAMNYTDVNRLDESLSLHEKLVECLKSTNGTEHDLTLWAILTYAQVCQRAGQLDRADRLLREALQQNGNLDASLARRQKRANALGWLARNLLLQQKYAEAEPHVRETLAIFARLRPNDPRRIYWESLLGAVLIGQKNYSEGEPLLLQAYERMKQRETTMIAGERCRLIEVGEWIVRYYEATSQLENARAWRERVSPNLANAASVDRP